LFSSIASHLVSLKKENYSPIDFATAFEVASKSLSRYGGAQLGDRTMIDALLPACQSFANSIRQDQPLKESLKKASEEAEKGAQETTKMKARAGRSSYISFENLHSVPDPGAHAVSIWIKAIYSQM